MRVVHNETQIYATAVATNKYHVTWLRVVSFDIARITVRVVTNESSEVLRAQSALSQHGSRPSIANFNLAKEYESRSTFLLPYWDGDHSKATRKAKCKSVLSQVLDYNLCIIVM